MQSIVNEAKKRAEEGILFVYVHNSGDPTPKDRDALGLVTDVDLVYGWIEIKIKSIPGYVGRSPKINVKFNPLDRTDMFDCVIVPCMTIAHSSEGGRLVVYEASITHFTLDMLPSTMDKSTRWGKRAQRIVEDNSV